MAIFAGGRDRWAQTTKKQKAFIHQHWGILRGSTLYIGELSLSKAILGELFCGKMA
jgi:hypothetical protein